MKNDFIKKANEQQEFSPEQIQELKRCSNDPIYFIRNYVKIQHPTKGSIPFDLYPYQERAIRAFEANRFTAILASRQSGKSIVIAAYILWYACFKFDKTVLVASNKNTNAMEIMHRIRYAYEELPFWLKPGCEYYTKHSIEFDNGSKIFSQATTENTGRGMSISLLMLDELAFVPKRIQEEMWTSMAPTLSTGGSCIISSTPNGDTDLFSTIWRGAMAGTNSFVPVEIVWSEHPDRDESFKKTMLGTISELKWLQEYENQFLSSDPLLISSLKLTALRPTQPEFEKNGFKFWGRINPTSTYFVGVDISTGVGEDFSVIEVFEYPSLKQVAEFRSNKVNTPQLFIKIKWILKYISTPMSQNDPIPEIYWTFESNGVGASIAALYYNDDNFPDVNLMSDPNRLGMATTGKNKAMSCIELKQLVEKMNGLKINSDILLFELKNYVVTGAAFAAKPGCTDDVISAVLMVIQLMRALSKYEPEIFDAMYRADEDEYYEENEDGENGFEEPMPICF